MGKIDVTMLIPSEIAKLSPAERARRQAVADEIRRTQAAECGLRRRLADDPPVPPASRCSRSRTTARVSSL
ncbi:MAG TPA: hypothetical protein VMD91_06435 [Candidatus Sulfotelmatobacter sp.]|nr:hypothetical protein [Candidatus Sulfotelmatobacter sp.]